MARQTPALPGQGSLKPPSRVTLQAKQNKRGERAAAPAALPRAGPPPPRRPSPTSGRGSGSPSPPAGMLARRPAPLLSPKSRCLHPPPFPLNPFAK